MSEQPQLLAKVQMPEKGVFAVRCPLAGLGRGRRVIVNLGYGPDCGVLLGTETYDPAVHGPSVPGYELLREQTAEDERQRAANAESERQMREEMESLAQEKGLDVRFLHVRMSLGRQRLFAWYASAARHCDLSDIAREAGRRHGVQVMARQLGPRDEVGMMGALGPCGRPCCCATWQARYPSGLTADRVRGMDVASAQPNGMCGRYKCCLAFEE